MTTIRLPDTSTNTTTELASCLVTQCARAYGSEGWEFESLRARTPSAATGFTDELSVRFADYLDGLSSHVLRLLPRPATSACRGCPSPRRRRRFTTATRQTNAGWSRRIGGSMRPLTLKKRTATTGSDSQAVSAQSTSRVVKRIDLDRRPATAGKA